MRNDTDIAPVLRFGVYNESWHENHLSDLIQLIESGWSPQCATEPAGEHQWGVLRTTSVSWDGFDDSENKRLPAGLEPRPEIEVTAGDILVTRAGPSDRVGVVAYVRRTRPKIMLSDKLIRLRVKALHCPEFIARCLGSQQAQDQLKGQKSGLAKSQTNISQQGLLAVRLVTPTLPEQQKIAAFLTAVDGRIEQLSRKKALLEAYKKGVMQQLFTQTLRFQDDHGHDFPAWEEKTLGDLCRGEVSNGVFNDPSKVGRGYKLINVSDMFGSFPVDMNKLTLVELELGEFKKNQAKYGDLFFTRSSLVAAGIAWSNVNLSRDEDITFDGHLMKISPDLNAFNPVFLAYLMHSEAVRRQFISRGKTGTMTTIGQKDILAVSFSIPCLPEQTKIAGFLSALDGKIGAVGEQMRQTQAWKKGLLQQMFV